MTPEDRLALLAGEVSAGTWADLGSGTGAFTMALAQTAGPSARIYSVERDGRALRQQEQQLARWARNAGPLPVIELIQADFTDPLPLAELDGVLFANSLHFQPDACAVVRAVARYVKPGGRIVVVEYDVHRSGPWVPYPLPSGSFRTLTACAGLERPRVVATRPSTYHGRVYSAVALRPVAPDPAQVRSANGT